jgi:hypothetical protein
MIPLSLKSKPSAAGAREPPVATPDISNSYIAGFPGDLEAKHTKHTLSLQTNCATLPEWQTHGISSRPYFEHPTNRKHTKHTLSKSVHEDRTGLIE